MPTPEEKKKQKEQKELIKADKKDKKLKDRMFKQYGVYKVLAFSDTYREVSEDENGNKTYKELISNEDLAHKTVEFKERLAHGETLNDIKYEAFAVAREAARRTIGEEPFPVQVLGAMVLHDGDVAEMKTGEGKTLTVTMAVYLNALAGKGVYIVTVNEYLAQRDRDWMGQIYEFLGLTVGVNLRAMTTKEKYDAHHCDICYTTNAELGFDYLRDNMAVDMAHRVLRGLDCCFVDEADSILIDESRTPLIISGGAKTSESAYKVADRFVKTLKEKKNGDYDITDREKRIIELTDQGKDKAARFYNVAKINNTDAAHRIDYALVANFIAKRDIDYAVEDGNLVIFDYPKDPHLDRIKWSPDLEIAVKVKEKLVDPPSGDTDADHALERVFTADKFVRGLTERKGEYEIDLKEKTIHLTEAGVAKAELAYSINNLYNPQYSAQVHLIQNALRANYIMHRDVDYLVDDNHQVQIIDQFTGRVLPGREWSDGLHQAVQAKEDVPIKQETVTLATITYQNFFRLFKKLAGMTGTAKTEEEEFRKIYNMRVVCVPTNKRCIRKDDVDLVFARKDAKLRALVEDVKHRHELGQPILIGTVSVESSEEIGKLLDDNGLRGKYEMLNAKNHAREAEIIARAGQKGAITLATNMAGRGTDIKLGEGVINNGLPEEYQGLCVLGTERHESRRIDNQLRGRSGRQGDIGYSRFYVSFDDTLLVRFAMDTARNYIERNFGDEALETKMVSNIITSAQKKIEGQNFDTRKSLLDYDDVLAKQRQIVYDRRDKIIMGEAIDDIVDDVFNLTGQYLANKAIPAGATNTLISGELLIKEVEPAYLPEGTLDASLYNETPAEDVAQELTLLIYERYLRYKKTWPEEAKDRVVRELILRTLDQNWTKHIDTMSRLRETIYLRSYGGVNPLQDYVNEGNSMFRDCLSTSAVNAVYALLNVKFKVQEQPTDEGEKPAETPANPNPAPAPASTPRPAATANPQPNGEGK